MSPSRYATGGFNPVTMLCRLPCGHLPDIRDREIRPVAYKWNLAIVSYINAGRAAAVILDACMFVAHLAVAVAATL